MSKTARLDLPRLSLDTAEGPQKDILERAKKEVGFIPNMYADMANLPGYLETYLVGYKRFRDQAGFTPAEQDLVFMVISRRNGCDYCMAAHSMLADKVAKMDAEVLAAVRASEEIPDAKLQALAVFTDAMLESNGYPSQDDLDTFKAAGYTDINAMGIVLALAVKTLSNYSNHIFNTPVDEAFGDYEWQG